MESFGRIGLSANRYFHDTGPGESRPHDQRPNLHPIALCRAAGKNDFVAVPSEKRQRLRKSDLGIRKLYKGTVLDRRAAVILRELERGSILRSPRRRTSAGPPRTSAAGKGIPHPPWKARSENPAGESSETETHVLCQLCHRWFRAVTYTHLRYRHGLHEPKTYKDEFSLSKITSAEVRARIADQKTIIQKEGLEFVRKSWEKVPFKDIASRLRLHPTTVRAQARKLGLPLLVEKWTADKVTKLIRRVHQARGELHSGAIRESEPSLYKAARSYFGSWKEAVTAAGIPYSAVARREPFESWSKERILQEIRALRVRWGTVSYCLVERQYSKLYAAARNHFGNWQSALRAALRKS